MAQQAHVLGARMQFTIDVIAGWRGRHPRACRLTKARNSPETDGIRRTAPPVLLYLTWPHLDKRRHNVKCLCKLINKQRFLQ